MKTSSGHPYRVLIADDQADIRDALRLLLKREGYETQGAQSPAEALAAIEAREFDAVLMDLNYTRDTTSGQEGLDLLPRVLMIDGTLPVIVMTAWSSVEVAVEAMRRGARDFIPKPWENNRLLAVLRTQIELRQALRQASRLEAENRLLRAESRPTMIAESAATTTDAWRTRCRMARMDGTLIFGIRNSEFGTRNSELGIRNSELTTESQRTQRRKKERK